MAKTQSKSSRYQSNYGGGFLQEAQYIAEKMCELEAFRNKTELPFKFWETDRWKKIFLNHLQAARSRLHLFSANAIISAIKQHKPFSLRVSWFEDKINLAEKQEREKMKNLLSQTKEVEETSGEIEKREVFTTKKSILDSLD
jgi:hypothetical protein